MPRKLTGEIFGSYKLGAQLGRGGMGTVYHGYQKSIDRSVAVKVMLPELGQDARFSARFLAEARTLNQLTHASILPLYEFGTANDMPYIVMPLMPNGTLGDRLGKGPLALAKVVRLLTPIAAALDYGHGQGVLHRDVKPSNILFDRNDVPLLSDFGIAKALEDPTGLTITERLGTPDYMSPEQARGEALVGQSDQYSLGVVVYQCLTGKPLFTATTPAGVMYKHASEPAPLLRALRPDLPQAVEAVVQRSLAKKPTERYQTASEFIAALDAACEASSKKRRLVKIIVGAVGALVFLGMVAVIVILLLRPTAAAPAAAAAAVDEHGNSVEAAPAAVEEHGNPGEASAAAVDEHGNPVEDAVDEQDNPVGGEAAPKLAPNAPPVSPPLPVPGEGVLLDFGTNVIKLADPGGRRYLKVAIVLEFAPHDTAWYTMATEQRAELQALFETEMGTKQGVIEDLVISIISSKSFEQVYTLEGKEALRQEIINRINQMLPTQLVMYVYFNEFVVQ